jgi:cytochrome c oxidase cbb3-type subunit III
MSRFRRIEFAFAACALVLSAFYIPGAAGQEGQPPQTSPASPGPKAPADLEEGAAQFQQNCSPCHGADASGGDGPNIRGVPGRLGDAAVQGIIRRGIPGTAMPASSTVTDKQAANIVAYLATLDTVIIAGKATGDPARGEALYNSSGCSTCHMIAGQGGSIGPDLSRIGAERGPTNLKQRLLDPGANLPNASDGPFGAKWTQYLMYHAVDKNGRVVQGMRVGEDSFTIVLKDAGGKFHGFWKPDLRSLEKEPGTSFMPSFKDTLSDAQMDDLVTYLGTLKSTP